MPERTSYQNTRQKWLSGIRTCREFLMALAVAAALGLRADAYAVERMTFKSAEAAATALSVACREHDEPRLLAILGPLGKESVSSGDERADKAALEMFAAAFYLAHELVPARGGTQVLHVGLEDWPSPLPFVKLVMPGASPHLRARRI